MRFRSTAMSSAIHDVSDTAFWIAHHRALETERSDALFRDPLAALLAGERGRAISKAMPTSRFVSWMVALRTRMIDEYIAFAIDAGIDTVLCLGAGLDARPYRLTLPAELCWIEADYPRIIDYKESRLQALAPNCRLQRVRIDLADLGERQRLFGRVNAQTSGGVLIITEGVIAYLDNEAVASLADALRSMRRARFWIADYFSAESIRFRRRRRVAQAMQNAPFKFAPDDWFAFFAQHGWQAGQLRFFPEEAARFGRPVPLPRHVRLLMRISRLWMPRARLEAFRKFGGYALLEPSGPVLR
jgi:methyltransferase (TIGR00027 family)